MKTTVLTVAAALFGQIALASKLYAASYGGSVYSLDFAKSNGSQQLSTVSESKDCGTSPSWLMLDREHHVLYCLNEAIGASNGSITSFKTYPNGSLTTVKRLTTPGSPVMSEFYSASKVDNRDFFAVAHYDASTVTTYSVDRVHGDFKKLQSWSYTMPSPGPNTARQDSPHPHGVFVDPTGRFALVPDLGADLIRIFRIDPKTGHLEPLKPHAVKPGSGPRHGAFWTPRGSNGTTSDVYFYLVNELQNTMTGFQVSYAQNNISFSEVYEGSTFGNRTGPAGSKVAGIAVSPENNHIIVSNRLDNTFGSNNDSVAIFSCADATGKKPTHASFLGLFPAYGSSLRSFDVNGSSGMISLALEKSQKVGVAHWDKRTGTPGKLLAEKKLNGDIPAVVWDL